MINQIPLVTRLVATVFLPVMVFSSAFGQGIPDDRNVNIVGINPPTATNGVSDTGLKQQNEPSCAVKPGNSMHIICAFNDYRGVDNPLIGDAWEGYAYSINGGQTWFSDLLPGHPGDAQSLGLDFAADPQVAAAPGVALVAYIAADRGENADGGLYLQRLFEVNREAGRPWIPAMAPIEVRNGNAIKFIDKPFMLLHPAPAGSGTITLASQLDDGTSVTQEVPAARLFMAHTEFSGSDENQLSIMVVSRSDDYGATWRSEKLSSSDNRGILIDARMGRSGSGLTGKEPATKALHQSASIAAYGDNVCIVWRRFSGSDAGNAIIVSCSGDRGLTFDRQIEISNTPQFYPFDQGTTEGSFRTNSYPVIANDGEQFYAFWANRNGSTSPFFARIVYSTSTDGSEWTAPMMLEDADNGHQFMPAVASARGTIQLAWYDSRNNLFQSSFIQDLLDDSTNPPTRIIRNKADIRTAQIINGVVSPSVQVSRYAEGALEILGPVEQLEFNFMNDRIFKQGTVPFAGDYPNVAAPAFRRENNEWVSNIPASEDLEPVDFIISWSDNRDVRGNVWGDLVTPTVYTPANLTVDMVATTPGKNTETLAKQQLAQGDTSIDLSADTQAVNIAAGKPQALVAKTPAAASALADKAPDPARADAEPDPADDYGVCMPGSNQDRSRNQNVYSSIVRPGVSIDSPSSSKPTGSVQRSHVIWVANNTTDDATYTITIDNQPVDAPMNGRASFRQVPVAPFTVSAEPPVISLDVLIGANSTVARTVYVSSMEAKPEISVSVTDGDSVVFGTLTLNADILTPDIQNPDVQNPDIQNPDIQNAEVHNPDVQNVVITRVANPDVQNPDIQNPDVQNPDVQNPDVQNPDYQNPDVQNPDIQNPDVQNMALVGSRTENPDVANETLTADDRADGYTDISYQVTNNGNTTTSFDLDAFINADNTGLKTQLIAARTHATESSKDCVQGKQVQNQIIFNEINPDLDIANGNSNTGEFGDGSAYIAPGETIFVTLRVWGDPEAQNFVPETVGINVTSQSCNSENKPPDTLECDSPLEQGMPTTALIGFNFVPPLTAGNNPDGGVEPVGSGVDDLNTQLARFGVRWQQRNGDVYLTDASVAGNFQGFAGPFLAFDSSGGPAPDGTHTANFICTNNSGMAATVATARVRVADTEQSLAVSSFDATGALLETFSLSYPDVNAVFEFTQGPIASLVFTDTDGDGHIIDNLDYTGIQCIDDTTPPVVDVGIFDVNYGGPFSPHYYINMENGAFPQNPPPPSGAEYQIWYQDDAPYPWTLNDPFYGPDPGPFVRVSDNADPAPVLVCTPASGGDETVFPPPTTGNFQETEVTCTATDAGGNSTIVTFSVFVESWS